MKTVQIKPVTAYAHGRRFVATSFNVDSRNDDLFGEVSFKHIMFNAFGVQVGEAQTQYTYTQADVGQSKMITISDDQSEGVCEWDASAEGAYTIVAQSLGLEIEPPVVGGKVAFLDI